MAIWISNEHGITERRYRSRKNFIFLLFAVFAFLSLASLTASLSTKLDGHPQARIQVDALAWAMLRDISQSAAQYKEEDDYSSSGPDLNPPPLAATFSGRLPAVNLLISLEASSSAASSPHPLHSMPLAPRAPPFSFDS